MPFVPHIQFLTPCQVPKQSLVIGFYLLFTFSAAVSDDSHCDDEDGEHETFLNVNAKVVCVRPPSSSWGILTRSAQGIKCITCGHSCGHAKFLFDSLENESCPDFISEFVDKCQQGTIKNIKILT